MRRKLLRFTPELVVDALRDPNVETGYRLESIGVPDDLRVVGCAWDSVGYSLILVIESSEFDVVPDGQTPPDHRVTFRKILL